MEKYLLIIIALIISLNLSGCGSRPVENNDSTASNATLTSAVDENDIGNKVVSLSMYQMSDNIGQNKGWSDELTRERLGVSLNFIYGNNNDVNVNSSDLWCFATPQFVEWAVDDNDLFSYDMFKVLDEKLLETYAPYLKKLIDEKKVQVVKNDKGQLIGFGTYIINGKDGPAYVINSDSDNIEHVLQFLDWFVSPEGTMTVFYGPKGDCWDIDQNGYYYLTELGKACRENGSETMFKGEPFWNGILPIKAAWSVDSEILESEHLQTYNYKDW